MKKKLLFIPSYIASLRYFEKLMPYLQNKYEVGFLFIPRRKNQLRLLEMINYCKKKNYEYFIIEKYQKKRFKFLPFYHAIKLYYDYRNKCRNFLSSNNVAGLIATYSPGFFYDCLFGVANQLGIKASMLEWVITSPYRQVMAKEFAQRSKKPKRKRIISFIKHVYYRLLEKITSLISRGGAKKIGVINQFSYDVFKEAGIPEKKITIVGYADFDLAKKTLNLLDNNSELKKETAKKYNLNLNKKNIIVYSFPLYGPFSPKQLVEYFYEIIKIIREVFAKEKADILFKLHPKERDINLYSPLKKLGVKLYEGSTCNEELRYFGNLHIDHCSDANFIPIVMQKDCIFLNLMDLKYIDLYKEMFSIKKFISDKNEFKNLLIDFKNGKLVKQYGTESIINDGKCIERIIKWID